MIELDKLLDGLELSSRPQQKILVDNITADSRNVGSGDLFAALPGSNVNGVKFIPEAVAKGAAVVLAGNEVAADSFDIPLIRADDPREILAYIAARLYPQQPETMVAVTGTAGKTSVASFVRQIFTGTGHLAASIGTTGVVSPSGDNYGNLTTPDPVTLHQMLAKLSTEGVTHAAMEASSHGLDQKRLHGVRLAAAGFTNLGRDHLDYHKDMDEYLQAKLRLFEELLPKDKPAVIFSDDPVSDRVADAVKASGRQVLRVGRQGDFLELKRVEHERYKQVAEIAHGSKTLRIKFPLAGDFQVSNGLVAAGLAMACGEEFEAVFEQLEQLQGASGRLELIAHNASGAPVYVDYAHKPDALEHVLKSLRPFASNRLVVVFGCGGDRDPGKRPIMGEIGHRLADQVIITDDNPRSEDPALVRKAILEAAPDAIEIGNRREAIEFAINSLGEGDCLVVAGKGHETGQIVGDEVLEFSDQEEVRNALGVDA